MKDEKLWYRHSAMNEKANEGLVFYFDSSAAADSTIIHHSLFIRAFVVPLPVFKHALRCSTQLICYKAGKAIIIFNPNNRYSESTLKMEKRKRKS